MVSSGMEYSITTKSNWNVEVYDVPVCVAEWITEHMPTDLDYIQATDVAELAADAIRNALHKAGIRVTERGVLAGRYVRVWNAHWSRNNPS